MFKSAGNQTRSCFQRLLLLLRDSYLSTPIPEHAGAVRHVQGSRYEEIPGRGRIEAKLSLSAETETRSTQLSLLCLDCNNHRLIEASLQNVLFKPTSSTSYQPVQISGSKDVKPMSNLSHCTSVEHLGQKAKVGSTYFNTSFLQPWRRPQDILRPLFRFISRTQNHLFFSLKSVRNLSLSTHAQQSFNEFHLSTQSSSLTFQQLRTIHQPAPRLVDAWRDCISPENENRCRQNLAPNLKLYEVQKVAKGASQSQGNNRSRWASILVSLCSVDGEPVFLFTLRSSTLKGRHKGDVSFAGGKSDHSDRDVVATALREAREELGITVAAERVWGVLKPLRDASGMIIAPVLANLGPLAELTFKPNPGEVDEIFTLSVSHLCNPQNQGYTHFRIGNKYAYTLPVFRNGKHRVWGLTAVALDHTLKLILPS